MENTIERLDGFVILQVQYQALDAKTAKDFGAEFDGLTQEGTQVLLDLEKVEFVDSAGLGSIVAALKRLRSMGGDMRICNVHKPVRALFELVRMHRLVDIFNDRSEALA